MIYFSLKIELCHQFDKDAFLKCNALISSSSVIGSMCLIKFCETLSDLSENKNIGFLMDEVDNTADEIGASSTNQGFKFNYVVFMIRKDIVGASSSIHELIRSEQRKNSALSNIWYVSVLYVSIS